MQSPKSDKEVGKIRRWLRNVKSQKSRGGTLQELLWRQIMVTKWGLECVYRRQVGNAVKSDDLNPNSGPHSPPLPHLSLHLDPVGLCAARLWPHVPG